MITMKAPQDAEVLQRLRSLPEFRYFVGKLEEEHASVMRELLYTDDSTKVESIRGRARAQHELLAAIAPKK